MANQYHDETGKFCSRNEMAFAVDRLALAGETDRALALSMHMSALQRDNEVELHKKLAEFMHGALLASPHKTLAQQLAEQEDAQAAGEVRGAPKTGRDKVPPVAVSVPDNAVAARDAILLFNEGDEVEAYAAMDDFNEEERYAFLVDPEVHADMANYVMRYATAETGRRAVIASQSPEIASAYFDVHGWPKNDEAFERVAFKAEDPESRRTFANYTGTAWGIGEILADEKTDSPTLLALAGNPSITASQANLIIAKGGEHTRLYRAIRGSLLVNGAVTGVMYARLRPEVEALAFTSRPALIRANDSAYAESLQDAHVNVLRLQAAIANPATSAGQRVKYERALEHVSRSVENIRAEYNVSHDRRVAQLNEDIEHGSDEARDYLAAADGYLLQRSDYQAVFG